MDYKQNSDFAEQSPVPIVNKPVKKEKKRTGWKIFWGIFTGLSVFGNIVLFLMLILMGALFVSGQRGIFTEEVIKSGPRTKKIAVINLKGVIGSERADDFYQQLKTAGKDEKVKGIIVRVNSPGGTVSASDRIYNEILKYRSETKKPVVAFMQGVAASGGYYASAACDKIIAEPTTITGSVGVIMGYLVLEELLEQKLGIQPIVVKSGLKKDWPSSFEQPTEEQLKYLEDKLIKPAYERFVEIVAAGREPLLTLDDVRRLSDGSIYSANEALDEKLIDGVGYLDEAIDLALLLAEITDAQVVEYKKPFSLANFLSSTSQSIMKIDKGTLYELSTPQVLYLWSAY